MCDEFNSGHGLVQTVSCTYTAAISHLQFTNGNQLDTKFTSSLPPFLVVSRTVAPPTVHKSALHSHTWKTKTNKVKRCWPT